MNTLYYNPSDKITAIKVILEINHGAEPELEANFTVQEYETFDCMLFNFKDKQPVSGFVIKKNKVGSDIEDAVFKNNIIKDRNEEKQ